MTRRKPHTVEDRTEKFNQREARRGIREAADRERTEQEGDELADNGRNTGGK